MPGPKSTPKARTREGRVVTGKTNLARAGLKSGQGYEREKLDRAAKPAKGNEHA